MLWFRLACYEADPFDKSYVDMNNISLDEPKDDYIPYRVKAETDR